MLPLVVIIGRKKDFLEGKVGSFIFLIANLFVNKLKNFYIILLTKKLPFQ